MASRILCSATLLLATTASAAPSIVVYEKPGQTNTTEGDAVIETDPQTAFVTAMDYAHWPAIFADLRAAKITEREGIEAHVVFTRRDGSTDRLRFHSRPDLRTLWFEELGGDARVWGEISFTAGDRDKTTRVHARLRTKVPGVAGLFVSDRDLRVQRQQVVRDDLAQLQVFFARSR